MSVLSRWFERLSGHRKPDSAALLNEGLDLSMDWGENWLAPIQSRLHKNWPHLKPAELEELNAACQRAMKFGHDTLYELRTSQGKEVDVEDFTSLLLAAFPWVNAANATRLFNQSTYYAWKAGGPAKP